LLWLTVSLEGAAAAIANFFVVDLLENLPFALIFNFTVQDPEDLVVTFPLFKVHAPETDHTFVPVEFEDAITEVA
jgi:hypothetical protein